MDNKKLLGFIFIVFSIIAGTALFVILSGGFNWQSIVVIILVLMFLAYGITRFIINRNDSVSEDEYSKKVIRLAASRSYLISLYLWVLLMLFSNIFTEAYVQIGVGVSLMGIVFLINMIVIKFTGIEE